MIKELKMFTIICDNCSKDVNEDTQFSCWNEICYLNDLADNNGWIKDGEKDYCNKCFEYDNKDKLIILKNKNYEIKQN
jgi:hypothetical protein